MAKIVTLDFETYWDADYSLRNMSTQDYIMDDRFEAQGLGVMVDDDPPIYFDGPYAVDKAISSIKWDKVFACAHNTRFDLSILAFRYGVMPRFIFDTLSMANALVKPHTGSSALYRCAQYFSLPDKKTELFNSKGTRWADMSTNDRENLKTYGSHDTWLCRQIFKKMIKDFPADELKIINTTQRMYLQPKLELVEEVLERVLVDEEEKQKSLLDKAGITNLTMLRSNEQFAALLALHRVDPPTKISLRTGKKTWAFAKTDKGFTNLLTCGNETVEALCNARMGVRSTIEATRAQRLLDIAKRHGKLAVPLQYYAAHTGRYGGAENINLQNIRRDSDIRRAIVAPKGHVVLAVDASQIEARVLAWWAEQHDLVRDFANNVDIYSKFAESVYGYSVVKGKQDTERFVGKTAILGFGYGLSSVVFHEQMTQRKIEMTMYQACKVVEKYRADFHNIPRLWWRCSNLLSDVLVRKAGQVVSVGPVKFMNGKIFLPNGMHIYYKDLQKVQDETGFYWAYVRNSKGGLAKIYGSKIVENVTQALARILTFDAMLECERVGYIPRLQVHDELVFVVPERQAETALRDVIEIMCTHRHAWSRGIPLAAEGKFGASYADAK